MWLGGCAPYAQTQRVEGYLITLYTQPKEVRVGETRVGLRIQDRDYKIVQHAKVKVHVVSPEGSMSSEQVLEPGLGRDFRTRIQIARTGEHKIVFTVIRQKDEPTLTVEYRLRVTK